MNFLNPTRGRGTQLLFIPLLILEACTHTLSDYSPQPITTRTLSPATPAAPTAVEPESVLPLTFIVDLTPIQDLLKTAWPERFDSANHPLGSDYHWNLVRDGEPNVSIQDGRVSMQAVYKGEIEARSTPRGCRLDPIYPTLGGNAQLGLRQEGAYLTVGLVNPRITIDLKPESDAKCNMFNIPVKDQLPELVNREQLARQMGMLVDLAGFRIPVQQVWDWLNGPVMIAMKDFNTQLCLYGKPSEIRIGSPSGSGPEMTLPGAAKTFPKALLQQTCRKPTMVPLRLSPGSLPSDSQPFTILTRIPVPYASMTQALQEQLFHTEMSLNGLFSDDIVIERATAEDASGNTLVTVEVSGDLNGRIYYWGIPTLAESSALLTLEGLQMDTESKRQLDTIKVGYWQQVDEQLRERISSAAMVDLSEPIRKIRTAVSGQHQDGDVTINLNVTRQHAQHVSSTPGSLVADLVLEGTAGMDAHLTLEGSHRLQPSSGVPLATPF